MTSGDKKEKMKIEEKVIKNVKNEFKITDEHKWAVGLIEAEGYIGFNRNGTDK